MKSKKLLPPGYLLIYILVAVFLHFALPVFTLSSLLRIVGVMCILFGVGINIWADALFKKKKTTVKPGKIPTALLTQGPFQISRHPMYLGFVFLLLGISFVLGSLSCFIAPILLFFTLQKKFIPHEEQHMEEVFGEKYREYRKRVRCWL